MRLRTLILVLAGVTVICFAASLYVISARLMMHSQDLMRLVLFIACVFTALILLIVEVFAFSRLSRLTQQVKQIGEKCTLTRVELSGNDELSLLADTINGMLSTLGESQEKLRAYNDNLERTVLERTRQIEYHAFHDTLTDLPNRALFMDRLQVAWAKACRNAQPIAILFLDLDSFKIVNDTLGHEAGDQMLTAIAQRLTGSVRSGDTVARLGGDEFIILLENVNSPDVAIDLAQRILASFDTPMRIADQDVFTSASIGIAFEGIACHTSPGALLRDADTAMYEVKASGKAGYMLFDRSMGDRVSERMQLETDLRLALDGGQLCMHYQPLIDLETGHLTGVEALVRWNHPTRGMLPPAKFIPIAEETGLILPIGYWVLGEACRQLKSWQQANPARASLTMNINLSGKQLLRPDVVDRVQEVLHRTGVEPSSIKLEITESVMMTDLEPTIERLYALKKLGIKLVMDDFGTGYSSMSNLHTFPLDDLKIDRAFVHRLSSDGAGASRIIGAIVAMAKALRLDVIGEGVETLQQADQLKDLGCDTVQGFYFALPATADALERFMEVGAESLLKGAGLAGMDGPDRDAMSVRRTSPDVSEERHDRAVFVTQLQ